LAAKSIRRKNNRLPTAYLSSFFSSLMKKRNKRNQERKPTPIFFGAHSAGTPEKIVVLTFRSHPRAIPNNVFIKFYSLLAFIFQSQPHYHPGIHKV
jgi:hypothetical protein